MGVLHPVKLILTNYPEDLTEEFEVENNPNRPEDGMRTVTFGRELYIEAEDFLKEPVPKYKRLYPNGPECRLKGTYLIRCTGCKTCEFACKDYKDLTTEFAFRKVYEVAGGETTRDEDGCIQTTCFSYNVSSSCQHCDNPACVVACPTGAMHKDEETGLVSVDEEVCIGCGACATSCPYGAPKVNEELGHSTKCDGCAERLAAGLKPVCVLACPARALDFGLVEEMAELGERVAIKPFGDPAETSPNLYVKACDDARAFDDEEATVANPLEVA